MAAGTNICTQAQARIAELGAPRRNNELWTFFPVAKIPFQDFDTRNDAEPLFSANGGHVDTDFGIASETDFAALLPIAKNARPMVQNIADGANEMAMIKCNNDFGHTMLNIGKGARASLEILDNKVIHEIAAERFDINVAEGADVEIFFANPASDVPLRFRHFRITQAAGSTVRFSSIERGNGTTRISIDCFLKGEGANFEIRTLNKLNDNSGSHHRLHIYHEAPRTTSTQFSRNLLDGKSYASYDGSVIVNENCTGVNSSQLVNTILLSDESSVSVKPILKIYHDDVECTHGNTCGELDAEQMFYLVSRGIPKETAKSMLMASFAKELFQALPDSPAKKRLLQQF